MSKLRAPILVVVAALVFVVAGVHAQDFLGNEFQVNTYTSDGQYDSDVAADAAGNFVVVWSTETPAGNDTDSTSISAQRFNASRVPLGDEFQVNNLTTGGQFRPRVAVEPSGDFVVVWDGRGTTLDNTDILGRRFSSSGMSLGDQFTVNTYTTHTQRFPDVAVDSDGDFVISFTSYGSPGNDTCGIGCADSVQARRFASSGSALGDQFQVNTYTTGFQADSAVASDSDGNFVVVWDSSEAADDSSSYSVHAQLYASNGQALGDQFQVNSYTTYSQSLPSVASDADGNFIVVWQGYGVGTDGNQGIRAQRYSAAARAPIGGEFQVNSYIFGDQYAGHIAMNPTGEFAVTWTAYEYGTGNDEDCGHISAREFGPTGAPVTDEFQVNSYTSGCQYYSRAGMSPDGNFVVVWQSYGSAGSDDSSYSIQGQKFGTQFLFADGFETGDTSRW